MTFISSEIYSFPADLIRRSAGEKNSLVEGNHNFVIIFLLVVLMLHFILEISFINCLEEPILGQADQQINSTDDVPHLNKHCKHNINRIGMVCKIVIENI